MKDTCKYLSQPSQVEQRFQDFQLAPRIPTVMEGLKFTNFFLHDFNLELNACSAFHFPAIFDFGGDLALRKPLLIRILSIELNSHFYSFLHYSHQSFCLRLPKSTNSLPRSFIPPSQLFPNGSSLSLCLASPPMTQLFFAMGGRKTEIRGWG